MPTQRKSKVLTSHPSQQDLRGYFITTSLAVPATTSAGMAPAKTAPKEAVRKYNAASMLKSPLNVEHPEQQSLSPAPTPTWPSVSLQFTSASLQHTDTTSEVSVHKLQCILKSLPTKDDMSLWDNRDKGSIQDGDKIKQQVSGISVTVEHLSSTTAQLSTRLDMVEKVHVQYHQALISMRLRMEDAENHKIILDHVLSRRLSLDLTSMQRL